MGIYCCMTVMPWRVESAKNTVSPVAFQLRCGQGYGSWSCWRNCFQAIHMNCSETLAFVPCHVGLHIGLFIKKSIAIEGNRWNNHRSGASWFLLCFIFLCLCVCAHAHTRTCRREHVHVHLCVFQPPLFLVCFLDHRNIRSDETDCRILWNAHYSTSKARTTGESAGQFNGI